MPDSTVQGRFTTNSPTAPVANTNPQFLLSGFDLSGVGWAQGNLNKSFALVTDTHFIGATHFGAAANLSFRGSDGVVRNYGVAQTEVIKNDDGSDSDLFLGTLSSQVDSTIQALGIANLGAEAQYIGRQLSVYGQTARVGLGTINAFQDFGADPITSGSGLNMSRTYNFNYFNAAGGNNDAYFENGDSGSPSFIIQDGRLAVVGTHSALATTSFSRINYDTFTPAYVNQLNAALAPSGRQVTLVPEPSGAALALLGACFLLCKKRR